VKTTNYATLVFQGAPTPPCNPQRGKTGLPRVVCCGAVKKKGTFREMHIFETKNVNLNAHLVFVNAPYDLIKCNFKCNGKLEFECAFFLMKCALRNASFDDRFRDGSHWLKMSKAHV
jgi:hypothetical protein